MTTDPRANVPTVATDGEVIEGELVPVDDVAVTATANPLTEREAAVARLVTQGLTPDEIAEELAIGVKAVNGLLRRVTLKLEAGPYRLPMHVIDAAGRAGLLGDDDSGLTLSPAAEALRREGVPQNTYDTKTYQLMRYYAWCGDPDNGRAFPRDPVDDDPGRAVVTVIEWINAHWEMTKLDQRTGQVVKPGRKGQPYAPDTVRLSLAVVSVAYQRQGKASPTHHPDAIEAMRGYHRRWHAHGYRPDVAYVPTPDEVIRMVRACDLTTCAGLRDALLLRLAFDVGRRNSEWMALTWADITWESDSVALISFPYSKTNKDDGSDPDKPIAVEADTEWAPDVCPVLLLREWMQLCAQRLGGDLGGWVFREVNTGQRRKDGSHSGVITNDQMTRRAFQIQVAKYAKTTGVDRDPVSGRKRQVVPHSLRAAFATAAELAGVPENDVADRANWVRGSASMRGYMRRAQGRGDRNPAVMIRRASKAIAPERTEQ